jgi:hypothetical protein
MIKKFTIFEFNEQDPLREENWEGNDLPYEYNINVRIGRRLNIPAFTNIFEMTIENMHGDADIYTYDTLMLNNEEDLKKAIGFIAFVETKHNDLNYVDLENIWDILFDQNNDYSPILDFIEGDATCDGQRFARPSVKKVIFYNENGEKFNVDITTTKIR